MKENLTRRDFVKVAGVAALTFASMPTAAFAAEDMAIATEAPVVAADAGDATYTVTANIYVAASDSPIRKNAYVTNDGNPPADKPTSPVSNNATLVVKSSGKRLLTVPVVNTTFGVISFASSSTDGSVTVTETSTTDWGTKWGGDLTRIDSITFDVTNFTTDGTTIATFSPCAEFADFLLYVGSKSWDLHLVADCSAASA